MCISHEHVGPISCVSSITPKLTTCLKLNKARNGKALFSTWRKFWHAIKFWCDDQIACQASSKTQLWSLLPSVSTWDTGRFQGEIRRFTFAPLFHSTPTSYMQPSEIVTFLGSASQSCPRASTNTLASTCPLAPACVLASTCPLSRTRGICFLLTIGVLPHRTKLHASK